ncbi:hypothetical protein SCYAM73S_00700 [Streptomyces cyaneofuscatus]
MPRCGGPVFLVLLVIAAVGIMVIRTVELSPHGAAVGGLAVLVAVAPSRGAGGRNDPSDRSVVGGDRAGRRGGAGHRGRRSLASPVPTGQHRPADPGGHVPLPLRGGGAAGGALFLLALRVRPRRRWPRWCSRWHMALSSWPCAHRPCLRSPSPRPRSCSPPRWCSVPRCGACGSPVRTSTSRSSSPPTSGPGAPCWRSAAGSPANCTTWSPTTCPSSPSRRRSPRTSSRTRPTSSRRTSPASGENALEALDRTPPGPGRPAGRAPRGAGAARRPRHRHRAARPAAPAWTGSAALIENPGRSAGLTVAAPVHRRAAVPCRRASSSRRTA